MAKIAEVQEVTTDKLRPYEHNAKKHGRDQIEKLKASIREFGFLTPCLIDREFNLIAGHGRVAAAKELGMETVPCVFIEGLTETQRRAYILADNKLGELGEWDMDIVGGELGALADQGFDVTITGFDWDEAAKIDPIEDYYDPDTAPEIEPITKRGEIYQLGEHRLMCGDSTDPKDMNRLFGSDLATVVFTDPPYGVSIGSRNKAINDIIPGKGGIIDTDIENDTLDIGSLYEMLVRAFTELQNHAADDCSYYITSPQGGDLGLAMLNMMKDAGLPVRHIIIWVKNIAAFSLGRIDYDYRHEPVFYTWGKKHKWRGGYDNTVIDEYGRLEGLGVAELKELVHALRRDGSTSLIYTDKTAHAKLHPTMKPIRLVSRFIYNNSDEGDIVADIFGGSGTTLIAAEQLKRRCRIMELDPHYCDVIINRWEEFTGGKAVKIDG